MAFRRRISNRFPPCLIYGCTNRVTHRCTVCRASMCQDCKPGHVQKHAQQFVESAHAR